MQKTTDTEKNLDDTIEKAKEFFKSNWKSVIIVAWMLGISFTLIDMKSAIQEASSYNQVANMRLSVDDIRYAVVEMEDEIDKVTRTVSKLENTISQLETSVNRIYAEVRNTRQPINYNSMPK